MYRFLVRSKNGATPRRGLALALAAVLAWPALSIAQPATVKQGTAVLFRGHDSTSLIGDGRSSFEADLRRALVEHTVFPVKENTGANALIKAIKRGHICYLSVHGGTDPTKKMQIFLVSPSKDSKNVITHKLNPFKKDEYYVTAPQIRDALRGGPAPRLVLVNGCDVCNAGDGIPEANRMSTAFGITKGTKDRAFLGWPTKIVGTNGDADYQRLLVAWCKKGTDGKYPKLQDVVDRMTWSMGIEPVVIGDKELRYVRSGVLGIEFGEPRR